MFRGDDDREQGNLGELKMGMKLGATLNKSWT